MFAAACLSSQEDTAAQEIFLELKYLCRIKTQQDRSKKEIYSPDVVSGKRPPVNGKVPANLSAVQEN